jgi:hypothetical protein
VVKLNMGVDFEMIWDTASAVFLALKAAFFAASAVEFLILDGSVSTTGSTGVRASCNITKFTRTENLKGVVIAQASIKPTYSSNPAAAYTVP